jgi:hydrogenase-1 operon protein HyaF
MTRLQDIPIAVRPAETAPTGGSVSAVLHEVATLLDTLLNSGAGGVIDLIGLPLTSADRQALREVLAPGEVRATVNALGESIIEETVFCGVWWATHRNAGGERVAEQIEVTFVPALLKTDADDARDSLQRLRRQLDERTH